MALERHAAFRGVVGRVAMALYRAYFDRRTFRNLLDRTHITHRMLQGGSEYNPLFRLPPPEERAALLEALRDPPVPRVQAEKPVLIEWWRQGETDQLHLVNYADEPQRVVVAFPGRVRARALSPDVQETPVLDGSSLTLSLDVYTVLVCES
jgi:hypothetical protein